MYRSKAFLLVLAIIVLILNGAEGSAMGIPEYAKDLPQSLKNNCNVCHVKNSGGPMNDFGKDYVMYGRVMEAVEGFDSDGDGYDNSEELTAGTLPGFSNSYPGKKKGLNSVIIGLAVALVVVMGLAIWKRSTG
jgi:hypothetical protein